MRRFTAKLLMGLDMVVMLVLMLIFHQHESASFLIGLVCILIFAVLNRFLRCPSCGRDQGRARFHGEYCPYCGQYLGD